MPANGCSARPGGCWRSNDEIWAELTTPAFTGEVKLGLPYDLVTTYLPPVLENLCAGLSAGRYFAGLPDLADAGRRRSPPAKSIWPSSRSRSAGPIGECLSIERLVWVGCKGGEAYRKRPLPISIVSDTCAFRPVVFEALRRQGLPWRTVFANGSVEAITATVLTDLAVTASLASTIPRWPRRAGRRIRACPICRISPSIFICRARTPIRSRMALARHIREGFLARRSPESGLNPVGLF